jgi:hypothetical protein
MEVSFIVKKAHIFRLPNPIYLPSSSIYIEEVGGRLVEGTAC